MGRRRAGCEARAQPPPWRTLTPLVAGKGKVNACIAANKVRKVSGAEPTSILGLDWVTDSVEKGVKLPEDQYDLSVEGAGEKVEEAVEEEKVEEKVSKGKGKGKRAREPSEEAAPVAAGAFFRLSFSSAAIYSFHSPDSFSSSLAQDRQSSPEGKLSRRPQVPLRRCVLGRFLTSCSHS